MPPGISFISGGKILRHSHPVNSRMSRLVGRAASAQKPQVSLLETPTAVRIMPMAMGLGMVPVRKAEPVMLPAKVSDRPRARPKLLLPGSIL